MSNQQEITHCDDFERVVSMIAGKWKLWILRILIFDGKKRFNELQRQVSGITQTMLTSQLRALEADNLVSRTVYAEVPPKVEYSPTAKALALAPFFTEMYKWAQNHAQE